MPPVCLACVLDLGPSEELRSPFLAHKEAPVNIGVMLHETKRPNNFRRRTVATTAMALALSVLSWGSPGKRGPGGNLPPQLGRCGGAVHQTLDCQYYLFLFLFLFSRELGSLLKIVGQIREVLFLVSGYLGPRETFAHPPPPLHFNVVPTPLELSIRR